MSACDYLFFFPFLSSSSSSLLTFERTVLFFLQGDGSNLWWVNHGKGLTVWVWLGGRVSVVKRKTGTDSRNDFITNGRKIGQVGGGLDGTA